MAGFSSVASTATATATIQGQSQVEKLQPGQMTAPFQTPLGFHIVQLTEAKPARELSFEEVHGEIARSVANTARATAITKVSQGLAVPGWVR